MPAERRLPLPIRRALTWRQWWPQIKSGLVVLALFALAVVAARFYAAQIEAVLNGNPVVSIVVFVASSALAVLLPALTNLPLVPLVVPVWGGAMTAALLLGGWILGSALAFTLGRSARGMIERRFPQVARHADIERLIDPHHRILSLVLLRMTFPVDVLSYALGLFSPRTTAVQNVLATTIGAAPFAVLFALVPVLDSLAQLAVLGASTLAFLLYAAWMLRREP